VARNGTSLAESGRVNPPRTFESLRTKWINGLLVLVAAGASLATSAPPSWELQSVSPDVRVPLGDVASVVVTVEASHAPQVCIEETPDGAKRCAPSTVATWTAGSHELLFSAPCVGALRACATYPVPWHVIARIDGPCPDGDACGAPSNAFVRITNVRYVMSPGAGASYAQDDVPVWISPGSSAQLRVSFQAKYTVELAASVSSPGTAAIRVEREPAFEVAGTGTGLRQPFLVTVSLPPDEGADVDAGTTDAGAPDAVAPDAVALDAVAPDAVAAETGADGDAPDPAAKRLVMVSLRASLGAPCPEDIACSLNFVAIERP
jgi:hypothetical protein